jgi:electron transport complex protein RnfB
MTAEPDRQAAKHGRATAGGACTRVAQGDHDIPDGAARQQAQAAPSASAAAIDALLPQTQCTRCGHAGCRPYAEAIRRGEAEIDQCPPGGAAVISALATLLGRAPRPLNPAHGVEGPPPLAHIDERACIGCAKCLPSCPVDAIIGARKHMHTVVMELCTGCELCIAPCPVDCITLVPRSAMPEAPRPPEPAANRVRYGAHRERIERRARERAELLAARKRLAAGEPPGAE